MYMRAIDNMDRKSASIQIMLPKENNKKHPRQNSQKFDVYFEIFVLFIILLLCLSVWSYILEFRIIRILCVYYVYIMCEWGGFCVATVQLYSQWTIASHTT